MIKVPCEQCKSSGKLTFRLWPFWERQMTCNYCLGLGYIVHVKELQPVETLKQNENSSAETNTRETRGQSGSPQNVAT